MYKGIGERGQEALRRKEKNYEKDHKKNGMPNIIGGISPSVGWISFAHTNCKCRTTYPHWNYV
jgi:hypothetical protein